MGTLVKGLGQDRIVWGTDAVWTGAPQWQIEGLRRLRNPRRHALEYGYKPLGPADGPLKTAIFGGNSARLYNLTQHAELDRYNHDRYAENEDRLPANGGGRGNLRHGFREQARLKPVSRRSILAAALTIGAAPGDSITARAEIPPTQPVSKEAAQYQDTPEGLLANCRLRLFRAPEAAKSSPE